MRSFCAVGIFALLTACFQTSNSVSNDSQRFGTAVSDPNASAGFAAASAVMSKNCAACHDFAGQKEKYFTATRPAGYSTAYVVAGDPLNSPIYYRLRGSQGSRGPKTMPNDGSMLSADDETAIYNWISNLPVE